MYNSQQVFHGKGLVLFHTVIHIISEKGINMHIYCYVGLNPTI